RILAFLHPKVRGSDRRAPPGGGSQGGRTKGLPLQAGSKESWAENVSKCFATANYRTTETESQAVLPKKITNREDCTTELPKIWAFRQENAAQNSPLNRKHDIRNILDDVS